MYLIRPPFLYKWLFPKALFRMDSSEKTVYLTFDDGPHPEATSFVLDVLKEENVPATFFLLGKNAEAHPDLLARISSDGHTIANHGHEHLDGWKTNKVNYLNNFQRAAPLLGTQFFRPPYGRITWRQYRAISSNTAVVLWDVIAGDFNTTISPQQCEANVLRAVRNGSIIVMHDSQKALPILRNSLRSIIRTIKTLGYGFKKL